MAYKWILCVLFVISFSIVSNSFPAPTRVFMFSSFQKQFSNCSLPKDIQTNANVSLNETVFPVISTFCSDVHSEYYRNETKYILCLEVFNAFSSMLQCGSKNETSKSGGEALIIPHSEEENVCSSVSRIPKVESNKCFMVFFSYRCEDLCGEDSELCKVLLLLCQAKGILEKAESEKRTHHKGSASSVITEKSAVTNNKLKTDNKNAEVASHFSTYKSLEVTKGLDEQLNKSDVSEGFSPKQNGNAITTSIKVKSVSSASSTVSVKTSSKSNNVTQPVTAETKRDNSTTSTVGQGEDVKDQDLHNVKVPVGVTQISTTTLSTNGDDNPVKSAIPEKTETPISSNDADLPNEDEMQDYSNDMTSSNIATESRSYDKFKTASSAITSSKSSSKNFNPYQPVNAINPVDSFDKEMAGDYMESDDSHFFLFFICVVGLVIGCYVLFHNKQKIIALIVEGRHERRRRPNGASYKKLETKQ